MGWVWSTLAWIKIKTETTRIPVQKRMLQSKAKEGKVKPKLK